MADRDRLEPFAAEDWFLRRILDKAQLRRGQVRYKAFWQRDKRLSLTFQAEKLQSRVALREYQLYWGRRLQKEHGIKHCPAICRLSYEDLVVRTKPPLVPQKDPDSSDEEYGHLHYDTDPPEKEQARLLARLASENGGIVAFGPLSERS